MNISRRDFLKGMAAGAVSAASVGMLNGMAFAEADTASEAVEATDWRTAPDPIDASQIKEEYSADIVIVGAGHAGSSASRAAAEAGASVIVIEKQDEDTQLITGNDFGTINSKFATEKGAPTYDPYDLMTDWQRRAGNRTNPDLVRQFAQNCGDVLDWFLEPLSQEFKDTLRLYYVPAGKYTQTSYSGYNNFIGTVQFYGGTGFTLGDAVKVQQQCAKDAGAQYFYGISGAQVVMEDGRAVAVIGQDKDGNYYKYNAAKAVVLSCGDCSGNSDMVYDLYTELADIAGDKDTTREALAMGMGRDGSGIRMGLWAGGHIQPAPRAAMAAPVTFMAGPFGGVAWLRVNNNGDRFTNEDMMGPWGSGTQAWRQPKGIVCTIFDSNWREDLEYQAPDHAVVNISWPEVMENLENDMANYVTGPDGFQVHDSTNGVSDSTSTVFAADSLEELGGYLGLSEEATANMIETVNRYNELCDKGVDEDYGKEACLMRPIKEPPFFGVSMPTGIALAPMNVMSGIMIDKNQQVLDADNHPIPGLYATGNNSGGRFAIQYSTPMAGCSIGIAQTLGKLCGDYLATL